MYKLKSPFSAQLEITNECNYECRHCYNFCRLDKFTIITQEENTRYDIDHYYKIIDKLIKADVRQIVLTGGEPFIFTDLIYDLVKYIKRNKIRLGINTNGVLLDRKKIAILENLDLDYLLVSFPSCDKHEYNYITNSNGYDYAIKALENLSTSKLDIYINMVVSNCNSNSVFNTGAFIQKMGLKNFSATPVLACPNAEMHKELSVKTDEIKIILDQLIDLSSLGLEVTSLEPLAHCMFTEKERMKYKDFLKFRSCSAGISEIGISPNGDIKPCAMSQYAYKNLINESWEECWESLNYWRESSILPQICKDCYVSDFCGGGCRVNAEAINGKVNSLDPNIPRVFEPIKNVDYLMLNQTESNIINFNKIFTVDRRVFHRNESFGGVVALGDHYLYLKEDPYMVFKYLVKLEKFKLSDITEYFDVGENDLNEFINTLFSSSILNQ